jgi:16S rRNA (cytosine1407-C5)-methyltransferase
MENLRPTPNHPERQTTTDERLRLQSRQVELLISGLSALKTGGQMVYATCSLAPEEDEAVLDTALKAYPNAFSIEDVSGKFSFHAPGLTGFEDQTFLPSIRNALRLWPHLTGMSGFFCALLTKKEPISLTEDSAPQREFSKTNLDPVRMDQFTQINELLGSNYGLDLPKILEQNRLELFSRFDQIFLLPRAYLDHFASLPYTYIGMPLGEWHGADLELSHPFISRFGLHFTNGKIIIPDSYVEQWIAGRDIRYPDSPLVPRGQYLLVTDSSGRNLGLGRLLPKRLRNLLPRQSV